MFMTLMTALILIIPAENSLDRIIGGKDVLIQNYPFTVSIMLSRKSPLHKPQLLCGASIIRKYWSITAAQCIVQFRDSSCQMPTLIIYGNTTYSDGRDRFAKNHDIVACYVHELYSNTISNYNIALVKVKQPFNGRFEQSIPMAGKNYVYKTHSWATVLGWGRVIFNHPSESPILKKARMRLIDHHTCRWMYNLRYNYTYIHHYTICVGGVISKGICIGDGGGPLVQNGVLLGIASFALQNCHADSLPAGYVNVAMFYNWIIKHIGERRSGKKENMQDYC